MKATGLFVVAIGFALVGAATVSSDDHDSPIRSLTIEDADGKTTVLDWWAICSGETVLGDLSGQIGLVQATVPVKEIATFEVSVVDKDFRILAVSVTTTKGEKITLDQVAGELRVVGATSWGRGSVRLMDVRKGDSTNKPARKCGKCSRQISEPDWKFCPYDGTEVK